MKVVLTENVESVVFSVILCEMLRVFCERSASPLGIFIMKIIDTKTE